ncbi:DNA ligase D [Roseococcus sp. SYP-B2431]|uniref:DNA ligase D n=1 Tax=Roseococcus sp. SYP-B2431 TaxID=2496640 RepID=UPI00103EE515|nr:DNA ligase D [Roseococcus sp. SYP-B2431]TCI00775.1 DNA ligase D [Roseococcus sp. SYP-B2431]
MPMLARKPGVYAPAPRRLAKASPKLREVLPLPVFRPPQLATLVDHVPAGDRWIHEMKFDGYRVQLAITMGQARAYTRSGLDWSEKFAPIVAAAQDLKVSSALIDGEAVVLDAQGRSDFQALQQTLKGGKANLTFFAFDLLELDGEDMTGLPQIERKRRLEAIVNPASTGIVRYSQHIVGRGEELLTKFCGLGLEGVISKLADARYVATRGGAWLKTKCLQRQEFVVAGWTESDKAREFRSLILAVNEGGVLRYAGKVGTGWNAREMTRVLKIMKPLEVKGPTVQAPTAKVKAAHWLQPELVAEVAYAEMTDDGELRHASYIGLREDKKPEAVVAEKPKPLAAATSATPAIAISNPDRVLFPEAGITKGQLAAYYRQIADVMLPWCAERPLTLIRCPQGRAKKCFFQKHDAGAFGDTVKQVAIREKNGTSESYMFIESPDGLLTCVQNGTIEFHGWGSRIEDVEKADRLVFDLDPDEGLGFQAVRDAAVEFRDLLRELGLETFPMVTGGKGVHVIAPLTPQAEWPQVKDFAHRFARAAALAQPKRFTAELSKARRKGRIFVDYLRNQRGATAVMPFAVRARPGAPVAVPITWDELRSLDRADHWHIGDAAELTRRAASKALTGWGRGNQALPDR